MLLENGKLYRFKQKYREGTWCCLNSKNIEDSQNDEYLDKTKPFLMVETHFESEIFYFKFAQCNIISWSYYQRPQKSLEKLIEKLFEEIK